MSHKRRQLKELGGVRRSSGNNTLCKRARQPARQHITLILTSSASTWRAESLAQRGTCGSKTRRRQRAKLLKRRHWFGRGQSHNCRGSRRNGRRTRLRLRPRGKCDKQRCVRVNLTERLIDKGYSAREAEPKSTQVSVCMRAEYARQMWRHRQVRRGSNAHLFEAQQHRREGRDLAAYCAAIK